MALQWPRDKISVINDALVGTGNQPIAVLEDGSDEYAVASSAYERALGVLLNEHGWVHATKVNANLTPSPTAPADDQYDTAYPLPDDLLHLIWVRLDDAIPAYDIQGGQIVLRRYNAGTVSIKYVSADNSDPTEGTPLFVEALTEYVEAGLYRGLNNDPAQAKSVLAHAEFVAQKARTRSDQQKPKRSLWNSRVAMSRRVRRPWSTMPPGWSGTGNPG